MNNLVVRRKKNGLLLPTGDRWVRFVVSRHVLHLFPTFTATVPRGESCQAPLCLFGGQSQGWTSLATEVSDGQCKSSSFLHALRYGCWRIPTSDGITDQIRDREASVHREFFLPYRKVVWGARTWQTAWFRYGSTNSCKPLPLVWNPWATMGTVRQIYTLSVPTPILGFYVGVTC